MPDPVADNQVDLTSITDQIAQLATALAELMASSAASYTAIRQEAAVQSAKSKADLDSAAADLGGRIDALKATEFEIRFVDTDGKLLQTPARFGFSRPLRIVAYRAQQ